MSMVSTFDKSKQVTLKKNIEDLFLVISSWNDWEFNTAAGSDIEKGVKVIVAMEGNTNSWRFVLNHSSDCYEILFIEGFVQYGISSLFVLRRLYANWLFIHLFGDRLICSNKLLLKLSAQMPFRQLNSIFHVYLYS